MGGMGTVLLVAFIGGKADVRLANIKLVGKAESDQKSKSVQLNKSGMSR